MPVKIRPLHDRLIVERIDETEQMVGGIIIPDTAKEKPQQGKVLAVGKGKVQENGTLIPVDVQAGDKVLFGKYSGQEIKLDGTEYFIMREDEVLESSKKASSRHCLEHPQRVSPHWQRHETEQVIGVPRDG